MQHLQQASSEYKGEVSIYTGELTDRCIVESVVIIKKAFPALPLGFYDVFMDMVRENNFTDDRLRNAVKHVICTCVYPSPTIAQFISFDRKIKILNYSEYCKMCEEGTGTSYQPVKLDGRSKPVYAHIDDIKQYKLTIWKT